MIYPFIPHRATLQLLRFQATARLSRTLSRFRGPRRLAMSLLAIVLTVVWLGQVAAGLLLREPADPRKLAVWIPAGLLAYAIWHLLKTACRTPIEPFEWTPAEQELLGGAPLERHELVMYRLMAIGIAAMAKAACFSLVMLPDLPLWAAGAAGMFLALLFIDLWRMMLEVLAYGLSRREFLVFRAVVLGVAGLVLAGALARAMPWTPRTDDPHLPVFVVMSLRVVKEMMALQHTVPGTLASMPFNTFAHVILVPCMSWLAVGQLLLAASLVVATATLMVHLDVRLQSRRIAAQRRAFHRFSDIHDPRAGSGGRQARIRSTYVPPRLFGIVPLAWRQGLGAIHYRTSLGVAMIVPGILSVLTLFTPQAPHIMLLQLLGGLVFYSFLLLPTAFKFDFRRDVDRLAVLKALPVSPLAVTLGQLAIPVLLATLFQLAVLLVAMIVRPYHVGLLAGALSLLIPTNVLIFAMENVIFLLYPYRLNQEGLGVFFRSILTFTGKGILFAVALAIALAWGILARHISARYFPGTSGVGHGILFVAGLWSLITTAAVTVTALLVGVYRGFDPSQDTPAA